MQLIDVMHLGRPRVIGAWLVDDVVIDPGPTSVSSSLLAGLGDQRPRALLLTHIHLDHAGASGSAGAALARARGVRPRAGRAAHGHRRSAARERADALRRGHGPPVGRDAPGSRGEPAPSCSGGETLFDGAFEVAYTPGHASHHVSYLHSPTASRSWATSAECRIAGAPLTIPPSPPPDIDVEKWHESIELIAALEAASGSSMTHFGAERRRRRAARPSWRSGSMTVAAIARAMPDRDIVRRRVRAEVAERADPETARRRYEQAAPPDQLYAGLERYWRKRCGGGARGLIGRREAILAQMSQTVELPRVADRAATRRACGGWSCSTTTTTPSTTSPRRSRGVIPGCHARRGLPVRRPDPQERVRDRLERPARRGRAVLGAAERRRADDGAARVGVSRSARRAAR